MLALLFFGIVDLMEEEDECETIFGCFMASPQNIQQALLVMGQTILASTAFMAQADLEKIPSA
jgi:hypothetical protein